MCCTGVKCGRAKSATTNENRACSAVCLSALCALASTWVGALIHSVHVQSRATIAYLVLAANLAMYATGLGVGLVNGRDASQVNLWPLPSDTRAILAS